MKSKDKTFRLLVEDITVMYPIDDTFQARDKLEACERVLKNCFGIEVQEVPPAPDPNQTLMAFIELLRP